MLYTLQSDVGAKRGSLETYQAYVKDLLAENISIINSIIEVEEKTVCTQLTYHL